MVETASRPRFYVMSRISEPDGRGYWDMTAVDSPQDGKVLARNLRAAQAADQFL